MILFTQEQTLYEKAEQLAEHFHLDFTKEPPSTTDWFLELTSGGLVLHAPLSFKFSPLTIDFCHFTGRVKEFGRNELLAKAMTRDKKECLWVVDATAGLGRDAFLLAALGHRVTLVERHPVLAAMLDDAIFRAKQSENRDIAERMTLVFEDSQTYLSHLDEKPDVIYLDPMFPERTKTSLVKKEMQALHQLVGKGDGSSLLALALQKAQRRVVVKRPAKGECLDAHSPSFQITSKTHRFDIYVPRPGLA